jgi:hypothetical protein
MVRSQIKSQVIISESKEFAFTKLMACGLCGSNITADEKFKKLADGTINRYIYYGCTKGRDRDCKSGYINEIDLIKQFEQFIEKVNINEIGIKEKIKAEVQRVKSFQHMVLGSNEKVVVADIDMRNYAKFILRSGTDIEKRELLGCFKSQIVLENKQVYLKN